MFPDYRNRILIPEDCGSEHTTCSVDLLQLEPPLNIRNDKNVYGFAIGNYTLLFEPNKNDCKVHMKSSTATVILTWSPQEIMS